MMGFSGKFFDNKQGATPRVPPLVINKGEEDQYLYKISKETDEYVALSTIEVSECDGPFMTYDEVLEQCTLGNAQVSSTTGKVIYRSYHYKWPWENSYDGSMGISYYPKKAFAKRVAEDIVRKFNNRRKGTERISYDYLSKLSFPDEVCAELIKHNLVYRYRYIQKLDYERKRTEKIKKETVRLHICAQFIANTLIEFIKNDHNIKVTIQRSNYKVDMPNIVKFAQKLGYTFEQFKSHFKDEVGKAYRPGYQVFLNQLEIEYFIKMWNDALSS